MLFPEDPNKGSGAGALLAMVRHSGDVDNVSDGALIDAVLDEVCAHHVSVVSREGALLWELLDRFPRAAGVEETPKGVTIDGEPAWPDIVGDTEKKLDA